MFGNKLRSWMEAVRPKKKQQRKDKHKIFIGKSDTTTTSALTSSKPPEKMVAQIESKSIQTICSNDAQYLGNNLSSPESAYSTGYSTDGTSPGPLPAYYLNAKNQKKINKNGNGKTSTNKEIFSHPFSSEPCYQQKDDVIFSNQESLHTSSSVAATNTTRNNLTVDSRCTMIPESNNKAQLLDARHIHQNIGVSSTPRISEGVTANSCMTSPSPLQRNRIRTNPWVPGISISPGSSSIGINKFEICTPRPSLNNSPLSARCRSSNIMQSPKSRHYLKSSLSSSSCSSLSGECNKIENCILTNKEDNLSTVFSKKSRLSKRPSKFSISDEEDCTLNEMMGKYDETYIYEKETDIISDSDPTDCDTDIDTGQDGGDEEDTLDSEFDFIDNGSFLEINTRDDRNTGKCTYFFTEKNRNFSKKKSSCGFQENNSFKSRHVSQKRRRSSFSKKKPKSIDNKNCFSQYSNETRSAGSTPIFLRRTKREMCKLAIENNSRKRSNSVSCPREPSQNFDLRDKEADKKYRELIVEADQILKHIKSVGLSPRRLPGPANKRVEFLRFENARPDIYAKKVDDVPKTPLPKHPSNFSIRFSPKRNHLTNFINNNSPLLLRKEIIQSPLVCQNDISDFSNSSMRKHNKNGSETALNSSRNSKTALNENSSSDSDEYYHQKPGFKKRSKRVPNCICPQSEPLKRKSYINQCKKGSDHRNNKFGCQLLEVGQDPYMQENKRRSCESLRHQVLLNTISNLKKSLEDQSASLKQVYQSSQHLDF